ncbi:MAG: hypothetical protein GX354_04405 [Firmicutes bacterium]|nr:hypothetical protein [Bacillota bacterium]
MARLLTLLDLQEEIPVDVLDLVLELNPLNVRTWYPDDRLGLMEELNEEYASSLLRETRRPSEWLKTRLQSIARSWSSSKKCKNM